MKPIVTKDHRDHVKPITLSEMSSRDIDVPDDFRDAFNTWLTDCFCPNLDAYLNSEEANTYNTHDYAVDYFLEDFVSKFDMIEDNHRWLFRRNIDDFQDIVETVAKLFSRIVTDSVDCQETFNRLVMFDREFLDSFSNQELLSRSFNKALTDSIDYQETFNRLVVFGREFLDSFSNQETLSRSLDKGLMDSVDYQELLSRSSNKGLMDSVDYQEILSRSFNKGLTDTVDYQETFNRLAVFDREFLDNFSNQETLSRSPNKGLIDSVDYQETLSRAFNKGLTDTANQDDLAQAYTQDYFESDYGDYTYKLMVSSDGSISRSLDDLLTPTESVSVSPLKVSYEEQSLEEIIEMFRNRHLYDNLDNFEEIYLYSVDYFEHTYSTNDDYVVKQSIRI
jgi:hypothetical protein